jgi:DNA-binding CsgD family transcriptional regulator
MTTKNIYDEIGRPSVKNHKKILYLTEPLNQFLGIDRFWRNFHRSDGVYSVIGNHPPTAEVFFGQKLYHGHPYFRNPMFFKNGYAIPEVSQCKDYEMTQGRLRDKGCYHVLIHIRKQPQGFVEYGFAKSTFCPGFEMAYLNNLSAINNFINFFEDEAMKLIQESNNYCIRIPELVGEKYNERPKILSHTLMPQERLHFLSALEKNPRIRSFLSLTKCEKLCVSYSLSGLSAKDIAKKLHRSPRTIETHLENAKGKMGIKNRSELFELFFPLREFLIPDIP